VDLPTAELPPEAVAGAIERPARKVSRHPKLDSVLAEIAAEAVVSTDGAIGRALASRIPARANRVQVEVAIDPARAAAVLLLVRDLGGEITSLRSGATAYQAWLPPETLIALADRPEVL